MLSNYVVDCVAEKQDMLSLVTGLQNTVTQQCKLRGTVSVSHTLYFFLYILD